MGATNIVSGVIRGTDYRDAYQELVREATFEYGHDPYNGTWSTMGLSARSPHRVAQRYSKTAERAAMKYIDEQDYGVKWEARVVDLGIVGYEVSSFVKVPHTTATAQYQTRFVAYAGGREIGAYKTAAEARDALTKAMGGRQARDVDSFRVVKESRNVNKGSTVACAYERKSRTTKGRPKAVAKGAEVREVHAYVFYGWASC